MSRPGNLHRLGHADLSDEGSFRFLVEKSTPHPDYKKGDPNILNDIAILHLERPVRLTNAIRPVCLPTPKASAEKQAEAEDTNLKALKPAIFTSSLKFLLQQACFFNQFAAMQVEWIFRILEFSRKFLEFREKILEFSGKFLDFR